MVYLGMKTELTKEEKTLLTYYNKLVPSKFIYMGKEVFIVKCDTERELLTFIEDGWEHSAHFTNFKLA